MSTPAPPRRDLTGYALVAGSFLVIGLSGTLVTWAMAPGSVLLVLRFALAAVVLVAVFWRRRPLAGVFRRGLWPRLLLMGALDAGTLLAYFFAVRTTGVAVATFLMFIQPVWVALLAPRLLGTPTERVVLVALGLAVAGLGAILAPSLLGDGVDLSVLGLIVGLTAGVTYALFQLLVKGLTREVPSTTIVITECALDAIFLLPLALWQVLGAGAVVTGRDLVAAAVLGLLCTAVAYTMWVDGVARVRVQHSSILGFLTPLTAPVYAFVLLGQGISLAVAIGGALILGAGLLVVVFGGADADPETPL
jgi:drug/metabolite transporter (DMT)-like permease